MNDTVLFDPEAEYEAEFESRVVCNAHVYAAHELILYLACVYCKDTDASTQAGGRDPSCASHPD